MERPAMKYHIHDVILLMAVISIAVGGIVLWLLEHW
jgi:hypothetical protein